MEEEMDFLFVRTCNSITDIVWGLIELNHNTVISKATPFDTIAKNPDGCEIVRLELKASRFDFVISYCFLPEISDICEELSIRYISWTYDSPLTSFYCNSAKNSVNYSFVFDRAETEHLLSIGIPNVFHMPMGVNISRTGSLNITKNDEKKFSSEISFVGNLYENNMYNQTIGYFPLDLSTHIKSYLMSNLCKWDKVKEWHIPTPEIIDFIATFFNPPISIPYDIDRDMYYGLLLYSRKLAEMDRLTVLNTLSEHFPVDLYTKSVSTFLGNIHVNGEIDYSTDMNKVFYLSKINLNITLPSIQTGIPQRIFDICGCGGFVLSNYQEEIDELFTIGKDIETFKNLQELLDKSSYYLSHEEERQKLAIASYMTVRDKYTYPIQLQKIIDIVSKN